MKEVLIFQHDPLEGPGVFAEILDKQKTKFRIVRLFQGEMPNDDWERISALLILGGAMKTGDEERYPFLRWEKTIIRAAIQDEIPILGICLGAQLIAAARGSNVYSGPVKEFGWHPVSITAHGQLDSLLGYLPERPIVFHWRAEGFDLPAGALRLASTFYYKNQAFRIGKTVYGLQFHLEVTPQMIARWIEERSNELAEVPYTFPDKLVADTQTYFPALKYYAERVLAEFLRRIPNARKRRDQTAQLRP
jgi:GMP synthase (glutamine-hydrolysing)